MNYLAAIQLLEELMTQIPQGVALWLRYKSDRDGLAALYAKGDAYVPTPEEWAALDARTTSLEADIDANAQRAAQP